MTEEEVIKVIQKVVKRIASKYRFGYLGVEDMQQEATILAIDALERYDEKRPLENFLATHIKRRLINFKRDKFERREPCYNCPLNAWDKEKDECKAFNDKLECKHYYIWFKRNSCKKNLMETVDMQLVSDKNEDRMKTKDHVDKIENQEIIDLIDKNIPTSMRHDWLRMLGGCKVNSNRMIKLKQKIKNILEENNVKIEDWEIL